MFWQQSTGLGGLGCLQGTLSGVAMTLGSAAAKLSQWDRIDAAMPLPISGRTGSRDPEASRISALTNVQVSETRRIFGVALLRCTLSNELRGASMSLRSGKEDFFARKMSCCSAASKLSHGDNFDAAAIGSNRGADSAAGRRSGAFLGGGDRVGTGGGEISWCPDGVASVSRCISARSNGIGFGTRRIFVPHKLSGSAASKLSQWDNFDAAAISFTPFPCVLPSEAPFDHA